MLRNEVIFENAKKMKISLPIDAPLGEVFDFVNEFRNYVLQRINESAENSNEVKEENPS